MAADVTTMRPPARAPAVLQFIERHVGLTPTGVLVLSFGLGSWLLAQAAGSGAMFMLAFGSLLVLIVSWASGQRSKSVDAVRSQLPSRVRLGQMVSVELQLSARRRVGTVVVEENLPPWLGTPAFVPLAGLPGGETVTHEYTFSPRLRGVHTVGPLVMSWSDGFGLTRRQVELLPATEIVVHPRTEPVQDRVLSRAWDDPPVRPPVSRPWPTGFEFYGTREYSPGDDPRRIMWRASARVSQTEDGLDRLLVREAEQGITDQVLILLDTHADRHSPGAPSATFERAVETVASVAKRHIHDGFNLSIESCEDQIIGGLRSRRDTVTMLDELARIQPGQTRLVEGLRRLARTPRSNLHYVIVTPDLDAESAALLDLLSARGASILVALVAWDDTDPRSGHRAAAIGANVVELDPGVPMENAFRRVAGVGTHRGR